MGETGGIKRVGVMMDLDKPHRRHVGIFAGIYDYAQENPSWHLIVDDWADHTLGGRRTSSTPYDGIIGRITERGAKQAKRLGVPAVNVWRSSPAQGVPSVFADFPGSGRLVAEHLLSRGFLNMAAFIHPENKAAISQVTAMKDAAETAGLARWCGTLEIPWAANHREWEKTLRAAGRWMDRFTLPVGLLVLEPGHARLIVELARERSWHIPQEVAIVCALNDEALCLQPEPQLTSVDLPHEQCGYEAAKMLDHLIDLRRCGGDPFADPQTVILPQVRIVSRFSTDFFAVGDPVVQDALRFIAAHLSKPLTVDDVVQHALVSRRTLDLKFHQAVGSTVAAEIARLRMERVKRELTATDDTIAEIARRNGFASIRTFNEQFQKAAGMTPRAFRQHGPARPA